MMAKYMFKQLQSVFNKTYRLVKGYKAVQSHLAVIVWLYFSDNMILYDQWKTTELKHTLLNKEALPGKICIRYGSPVVCWSPTKIYGSKYKQNIYSGLVWSKLKACMVMADFLWAATPCIFRQFITFHQNNFLLNYVEICKIWLHDLTWNI